jgi:hypothetical protein
MTEGFISRLPGAVPMNKQGYKFEAVPKTEVLQQPHLSRNFMENRRGLCFFGKNGFRWVILVKGRLDNERK